MAGVRPLGPGEGFGSCAQGDRTQQTEGLRHAARLPAGPPSGTHVRHCVPACGCAPAPTGSSVTSRELVGSLAGVQPRWIQGIRSGDGVGEDQETPMGASRKKAGASLVAQMVKNLLAMWETWI